MNYFDFSIITRWLELFSYVYVYHMRFSVGAWDTLQGRRKEAFPFIGRREGKQIPNRQSMCMLSTPTT